MKILAVGIFIWAFCLPALGVYSEEGRATEVREVFGFRYDLPGDYPIRKVNGVVQPAPLSEYVFMKMEEKNARIDQLETRLKALEDQLIKFADDLARRDNSLLSPVE